METLVFMQLNFVWWSALFDNGCYFSQQLYSSLVCSPLTVVCSKLTSCSYAWLEVGTSAEKHCCLIREIAKHCKVTFGDWLLKESSIYSLKKKKANERNIEASHKILQNAQNLWLSKSGHTLQVLILREASRGLCSWKEKFREPVVRGLSEIQTVNKEYILNVRIINPLHFSDMCFNWGRCSEILWLVFLTGMYNDDDHRFSSEFSTYKYMKH